MSQFYITIQLHLVSPYICFQIYMVQWIRPLNITTVELISCVHTLNTNITISRPTKPPNVIQSLFLIVISQKKTTYVTLQPIKIYFRFTGTKICFNFNILSTTNKFSEYCFYTIYFRSK